MHVKSTQKESCCRVSVQPSVFFNSIWWHGVIFAEEVVVSTKL